MSKPRPAGAPPPEAVARGAEVAAAASADAGRRRRLVVSLHDVSPITQESCGKILGDLAALDGRLAVSLLVIPNHHHRAPLDRPGPFRAWLRELVGAGHEPVLHGFYHQRDPRGDERFITRLVTTRYTAGEGEFFDLARAEAARRLRRGRRELEACCGAAVEGFIAPAWLLGAEAARAVEEEGFAYTTRLHCVERLRQPRCVARSQSLVWSVRSAWRRAASLAWNAALYRALSSRPLLRIGLHPPDWEFPAVRAQVLGLIRRALASRTPSTYLEYVRSFAP